MTAVVDTGLKLLAIVGCPLLAGLIGWLLIAAYLGHRADRRESREAADR